jgi:2-amino-4-hydroxy-6-hydroxymethyldihydropteridine diphosphokinase
MILIAIGANLPSPSGPPEATILAALTMFQSEAILIRAVAPFYQSAAWPDPNDPPFVNSVVQVETGRNPEDLLAILKKIEHAFGRSPGPRNAPRPLDLDILDFEGRTEEGPPILPHPRLQERGFVLIPLRDIAPDWRHPVSGISVDALIGALPPAARALTRLS